VGSLKTGEDQTLFRGGRTPRQENEEWLEVVFVEACQLYIEQQIEEDLQEGKTPYSIGKELALWLERTFAAKIPADTLKKRAQRAKEKLGTNVPNDPTHQENSQIPENQQIKFRDRGWILAKTLETRVFRKQQKQ
jgi:hypothetical protein